MGHTGSGYRTYLRGTALELGDLYWRRAQTFRLDKRTLQKGKSEGDLMADKKSVDYRNSTEGELPKELQLLQLPSVSAKVYPTQVDPEKIPSFLSDNGHYNRGWIG